MNKTLNKLLFWLLSTITLVGLGWYVFLGFGERWWLKIVLGLVAVYPIIGIVQGFIKRAGLHRRTDLDIEQISDAHTDELLHSLIWKVAHGPAFNALVGRDGTDPIPSCLTARPFST